MEHNSRERFPGYSEDPDRTPFKGETDPMEQLLSLASALRQINFELGRQITNGNKAEILDTVSRLGAVTGEIKHTFLEAWPEYCRQHKRR